MRDAAAAARALLHLVVLDEIQKLMADPLPQPRTGVPARIVARRADGEIRELAIVPGSHARAGHRRFAGDLVVDVEAVAARTEIGAGAAADAGLRELVPKAGEVKLRLSASTTDFHGGDSPLRMLERNGVRASDIFVVGGFRVLEQIAGAADDVLALIRHRLDVIAVIEFGHENIEAVLGMRRPADRDAKAVWRGRRVAGEADEDNLIAACLIVRIGESAAEDPVVAYHGAAVAGAHAKHDGRFDLRLAVREFRRFTVLKPEAVEHFALRKHKSFCRAHSVGVIQRYIRAGAYLCEFPGIFDEVGGEYLAAFLGVQLSIPVSSPFSVSLPSAYLTKSLGSPSRKDEINEGCSASSPGVYWNISRASCSSMVLSRRSGMWTGQTRSHSPQSVQRPARCIARTMWYIAFSDGLADRLIQRTRLAFSSAVVVGLTMKFVLSTTHSSQ